MRVNGGENGLCFVALPLMKMEDWTAYISVASRTGEKRKYNQDDLH